MKHEEIIDLEILIEVRGGNKYIVDLEKEDKKVIISLLLNYFKDGIRTQELSEVKQQDKHPTPEVIWGEPLRKTNEAIANNSKQKHLKGTGETG